MERAQLLVTGRVQGVWYRASTRDKASSLGLAGWVRNLRDGRVEIVAEGSREDLDALVRWAHEGPPSAQVADVAVSWTEASGEFDDFEVAPTA
jgi:acylphosphatase